MKLVKKISGLKVIAFLLFLSFFLSVSCDVKFGHTDIYAPDPTVEILTVFPCNGLSEPNRPIEVQPTFSSDTKTIHICAYQQKGGQLFLTVDWFQTVGGFLKGTTYVETDDGWFSAEIKVAEGNFPVGVYEVRVLAGKSIQATTKFEVISR
jgi:hypothetical protein